MESWRDRGSGPGPSCPARRGHLSRFAGDRGRRRGAVACATYRRCPNVRRPSRPRAGPVALHRLTPAVSAHPNSLKRAPPRPSCTAFGSAGATQEAEMARLFQAIKRDTRRMRRGNSPSKRFRAHHAIGMTALKAREGVRLKAYLDSVQVRRSVTATRGVSSSGKSSPRLRPKPAGRGSCQPCPADPSAIRVPLADHERDALISIAFNIGVKGFVGSTFSDASMRVIVKAVPRRS